MAQARRTAVWLRPAAFVGSDERRIRKALTDAALKPKPAMTVEAVWKDGELAMTASGPVTSVAFAPVQAR